ncbi:uncharacterized protein SOCE836_063350 [Sorangium cellulosum]|uniref:Uncharacterized protein n=1 Tax=Sorangium cellulosum TaxID=56 RepID=A0A4P2QVI0_SORCE|nr:uncharacterized protein SOCE836_063350 [Sorangium cellulosum]WCQ93479.1 hypothetical protein NQZ70_06228 [Sorangium sp. Soce836]
MMVAVVKVTMVMVTMVMVTVMRTAVVMMAVVVMAVVVMAVVVMAVVVMAVVVMAVVVMAVVRLASVHRLGRDRGGHLLDQREILDMRRRVSRGELRAADHRRGCREDDNPFYVLHRRLLHHGAPEGGHGAWQCKRYAGLVETWGDGAAVTIRSTPKPLTLRQGLRDVCSLAWNEPRNVPGAAPRRITLRPVIDTPGFHRPAGPGFREAIHEGALCAESPRRILFAHRSPRAWTPRGTWRERLVRNSW